MLYENSDDRINKHLRRSQQGVTLIELAVGMMLMAIIGVTVSSLVRAGVEAQMSQRLVNHGQVVVMNVVDDILFDLRTADAVAVLGGGNQLRITTDIGLGPGTITYVYGAPNVQRTEAVPGSPNNGTKIYNANVTPALNFTCVAPCFAWRPDVNGNNRSIVIQNLSVAPAVNTEASSAIAQAFPLVPFSIRQASFDVISTATYN